MYFIFVYFDMNYYNVILRNSSDTENVPSTIIFYSTHFAEKDIIQTLIPSMNYIQNSCINIKMLIYSNCLCNMTLNMSLE